MAAWLNSFVARDYTYKHRMCFKEVFNIRIKS